MNPGMHTHVVNDPTRPDQTKKKPGRGITENEKTKIQEVRIGRREKRTDEQTNRSIIQSIVYAFPTSTSFPCTTAPPGFTTLTLTFGNPPRRLRGDPPAALAPELITLNSSILSSKPFPIPSRSHSPPTLSSRAILSRIPGCVRPPGGGPTTLPLKLTPLKLAALLTLGLAVALPTLAAIAEAIFNPDTTGMCGGGSKLLALVVRELNVWVEVGVEARRSEYDMNESRFVGACVGEGGCDVVVAFVGAFSGGELDNLGDPAGEGDAAVFPSGGGELVVVLDNTCGLTTGEGIFNSPWTGAGPAPLAADLLPGLGLRLRKLSGLAKPLPVPPPLTTALPCAAPAPAPTAPPGLTMEPPLPKEAAGPPPPRMRESKPAKLRVPGATTCTASWSASDERLVRIAAALSNTLGTLCSSCSVALARGIRCGSAGLWGECEVLCVLLTLVTCGCADEEVAEAGERGRGGGPKRLDEWGGEDGEMRMGSMSRSKMAEEDEWMDVGDDGIELGEPKPRVSLVLRKCWLVLLPPADDDASPAFEVICLKSIAAGGGGKTCVGGELLLLRTI